MGYPSVSAEHHILFSWGLSFELGLYTNYQEEIVVISIVSPVLSFAPKEVWFLGDFSIVYKQANHISLYSVLSLTLRGSSLILGIFPSKCLEWWSLRSVKQQCPPTHWF